MSKKQSQTEIWVPIEGFEGRYEVSDQGRVRSLDRMLPTGILHNNERFFKGGILNPGINSMGYRWVTLRKNGERHNYFIHRLVLSAFMPSDAIRTDCNHKDGNKLNNGLDNLEWVTPAENNRHAFRTGLNKGPYGEMQGRSKLTTQQVLELRKKYSEGASRQELYEQYNTVCPRHIRKILDRKTWCHA